MAVVVWGESQPLEGEAMTVGELIKELEKFPPDVLVVMPVDPEGNGYYRLRKVEANFWDARNNEPTGDPSMPPCAVLCPG
jgi:hypothetical protein